MDFRHPDDHNEVGGQETLIAEISRKRTDRIEADKWKRLAENIKGVHDTRLSGTERALRDDLRSFLPAFRNALVRQMLRDEYLTCLQDRIGRAGEIENWLHSWRSRFEMALVPPASVDQGYILATFSLVEDFALTLTQPALDALLETIAAWEQVPLAELLPRGEQRMIDSQNQPHNKLDAGVRSGVDVLAVILALMSKEGLKPPVLDFSLQEQLIQHFEDAAKGGAVRRSLGGAAGNESFILDAVGWPTLVASLYNRPLALGTTGAASAVARLVFTPTGLADPYPGLDIGAADDPGRRSHVFQLTQITVAGSDSPPGPVIRMPGGRREYRPRLPSDRVILTLRNYRTDAAASWRKLRVTWQPAPGKETWISEVEREHAAFDAFSPRDWPGLPAFQHPAQLEADGTLTIRLASAAEIVPLASDLQAVLLGGIQALGRPVYSKPLTHLLRSALGDQLRSLSSAGVPIFFELSDVMAPGELIEVWRLCAQAGVGFFSSNRDELQKITSVFGSPFFVAPPGRGPEGAFVTYWRAAEFARRLGAAAGAAPPIYYIHDSELDVLLYPGLAGLAAASASEMLRRGQAAMLAAKALVPAALLRRAGASDPCDWDLVLSPQSLAALLNFAADFAAYQSAQHGYTDLEQKAIEEQVRTRGMYQNPKADDWSVAVAPAIHVDFPVEVSTAGAGDMNLAIFAAWVSQKTTAARKE